MPIETQHFDFVIVGGGTFGTSIAYAIQKEFPEKRVCLVEGTHQFTASKDINKIVRTAYVEEDWVKLAGKAMEKWETDKLYCRNFHKCGWVQVIKKDGYRSKMKSPYDRKISTEYFCDLVGSDKIPELSAEEDLWLNENVAYVDCRRAVEDVARAAYSLGVMRVQKNIEKLIIEESICKGAHLEDGRRVTADQTIVATGAWTASLLKKSDVWFPEDFFRTTAVAVALMEKRKDDRLKDMPILVTENGEIMYSKLGDMLKITSVDTFDIDPDDLKISGEHNIDSNRAALSKMLPQFAERKLRSFVCPDMLTPYQYPLLDTAPITKQLFIATGGSYHGHKFFPIIGDMAVLKLCKVVNDQTLEGRMLGRWTWDRAEERVEVHRSVVPKTSNPIDSHHEQHLSRGSKL